MANSKVRLLHNRVLALSRAYTSSTIKLTKLTAASFVGFPNLYSIFCSGNSEAGLKDL